MRRQFSDEPVGHRLQSDLAAIRFETALVRLELKYREDQSRLPRGPGGGRFADEHGGATLRSVRTATGAVARPAAATAVRSVAGVPVQATPIGAFGDAAMAAAPGMAPGAAAAGMGAIGVSQAAGRAAQGPNAPGGMTPFLHLPLPTLTPSMPTVTMLRDTGAGGEAVPQGRFDEECEEQLKKDDLDCDIQAAMYGRTKAQKNRLRAACKEQAFQRYSECLLGGVSAIRSPRFDGRQSFPTRRN